MMLVENIPTWMTAKPSTNGPAWLNTVKQEAWESFLQNGLPKRHDERFKYTDFNCLMTQHFAPAKEPTLDQIANISNAYFLKNTESIRLVFINGFFVPSLSDLTKLPANAIVDSLAHPLDKHNELMQTCWQTHHQLSEYPFAKLNAAFFEDGLFLHLPDECEANLPVHLLSFHGQENGMTHPRHLIVLGKRSKLTLIEEQVSLLPAPFFTNVVNDFIVGKEAKLDHYKIQQEQSKTIQIATTFVTQNKDSDTKFTQFSLGQAFSRDDLVVYLKETGADCRTTGFYRLFNGDQYHDHHVDIIHEAPCSKSEMLYKGVVGKKSRAVFNGQLQVAKQAEKIEAHQANHNLLLADDSEVYSKPELIIYADDVKCKHGATIGQLDQEALFYLRSRGISESVAMEILLEGFAQEVIDRATHPAIKKHVKALLGDAHAFRN